MTQDRFDIHQYITDQIVALIDQGAGDYRMPWHTKASQILPINIASGKPYCGVNVVALWTAACANGYSSGLWGTYRQWSALGAQVRRGQKSSYVVFYKTYEGAGADTEVTTRLFARATPVFAAEQVDGFHLPEEADDEPFARVAGADRFVEASGATIRHGGARAYYQAASDSIQLPLPGDFIGTATCTAQEAYYATLLHELVHWTSHPDRCQRELGHRFGDHAYAMEELVAELGAAFLCCGLRISPEPRADHAQYLASWLQVLASDKKAIFTAASKAAQAAAWLHDRAGWP